MKPWIITFAALSVACLIFIKTRKNSYREFQEIVSSPQSESLNIPKKRVMENSPNYFAKLKPLAEAVAEVRKISKEEIQNRLTQVQSTLDKDKWILRANQNTLSEAERGHLAALLQEESALLLVVLENKLDSFEAEL